MYEEVVKVPMIWSWPGRVPVQASRSELVSFYDVMPTLCEATGTNLPDRNLCGRSFLPIVEGRLPNKKQPWPNLIFGHLRNTDMARDNRYKLVSRNDGTGPGELYDEIADPREKVNQYANPQFVTVRDRLASQLARWKQKYS
jgi:arylsulfatase A-like enzyme